MVQRTKNAKNPAVKNVKQIAGIGTLAWWWIKCQRQLLGDSFVNRLVMNRQSISIYFTFNSQKRIESYVRWYLRILGCHFSINCEIHQCRRIQPGQFNIIVFTSIRTETPHISYPSCNHDLLWGNIQTADCLKRDMRRATHKIMRLAEQSCCWSLEAVRWWCHMLHDVRI